MEINAKTALGCCVGLFVILFIIFLISGTSVNTTTDQAPQLQICYDGSWSGAVLVGDSQKSIDGTGNQTLDLDGDSWDIVSANAQKMDGSNNKLTIKIIKDGKVVKQESTTAAYGIASVVD